MGDASLCRCWITFLSLLMAAGACRAQAPVAAGLSPCGIARGGTASLTLRGQSFKNASAVLVSGAGITARLGATAADGSCQEVTVAVAPDAPIGPREIRVSSSHGVTGPLRFWVGDGPEASEMEPNDQPPRATPLPTLPVSVSGVLEGDADVDYLAFEARAGETIVADVVAARVRSGADIVLELRDSAGRRLRTATAPWESDPRLVHRAETAGRYTLGIHDSQHRTGPSFIYRVSVGALAAPASWSPRGGAPGTTLRLYPVGPNVSPGVSVEVTMPSAPEGAVAWVSPGAAATPLPLVVSSAPARDEAEPNDRPVLAPRMDQLPRAVEGTLATGRDVDLLRFAGQAGAAVSLDLFARRIGSRADLVLRVLDASGKELAKNDDAAGKDPRLDFTPPADGDYLLEIAGLDGRGGAEYFYRLEARPLPPGLRAWIAGPTLWLPRDWVLPITIHVERVGGFTGPVTISGEQLPSGVIVDPVTLAPAQTSTEVFVVSGPESPLGAVPLRLVATGGVGEARVTAVAEPREQYLPRAIDPGMFTDDSYRMPWRPCEFGLLALNDAGPFLKLRPGVTSVTLAPGGKTEIPLKAERRADITGAVTVEVRGAPPNVTVAAPAVPEKEPAGAITLTAAPNAAPGEYRLILTGKIGSESAYARPVTLRITPPPPPSPTDR